MTRGRAHLQRLHVGAEPCDLGLGELEVRHTELPRLRQDRVVDVGDVAHHARLVTEILEPADQQVVGDVGRSVPEVERVSCAGAKRERRREATDYPKRRVTHGR